MKNTPKNPEVAGKKPEGTAAKDAATATQEARRPVQTFRDGDVSCSVWTREHLVQGKPKTFYSCTFERSYKGKDGAYRYTKSFDPEALGALVSVAQKAAEYLHGRMNEQDAR
jgi:hypothetical protein